MAKINNIVLISEGSEGHQLAFVVAFTSSLLRLGNNVLLLTPSISNFIDKVDPRVLLFERKTFDNSMSGSDLKKVIKIINKWISINNQVKNIEGLLNIKIDLVFFSWLDSYRANKFPYFLLSIFFRYKWSGLYFHPIHIRQSSNPKISIGSIDAILLASNCIGVGFHDEYVVNVYNKLNIKSVFFPEISDFTKPNLDHYYYKAIRSKANGRIVFGLVGPEYRKNALFLVRIALRYQNDDRFVFVFAGLWNFEGYNEIEKNEIQYFLQRSPSNVIIINEYIVEGEPINSLLNAFDVVFIVYKNFLSTSNYSTKAAFLNKIVISSNRFIIGEETNMYNLGILVDENNFEQLVGAVEMANNQITQILTNAKFDKYLEKHSLIALDHSFKSLIHT